MNRQEIAPIDRFIAGLLHQRLVIFGALLILALLAFETFNYSTTEFAMADLLGDLKFGGVRWSTILALAFCGIDFAGIARLLTPEQGTDEPSEAWYLLGAWFIAATMNAALTWWGVSIALLQHQSLGNAVIARETLLRTVPVFVAILVWFSRVLIIGTFSAAGDRFLWAADQKSTAASRNARPSVYQRAEPTTSTWSRTQPATGRPNPRPAYSNSFSPSPKPGSHEDDSAHRSNRRNDVGYRRLE